MILCDLTTCTCYSIESAWFQHLKLQYDEPLSNLAFNFILRRYTEAGRRSAAPGGGTGGTGDPLREEETARGARVAVPPPGAYEVGDPWRKRRDPRRRSEAFISKEYRFQEPKTTSYKAPGPGTYEAANKPRNPVAVQRSNFQSGSAR